MVSGKGAQKHVNSPSPPSSSSPNPGTSKELLQLEHLESSSPASLLTICSSKNADVHRCKSSPLTSPVQPPSVLSRVKAFLPVLSEANRKLSSAIKERGAEEFDIEVLNDCAGASYVQMDLALGIADLYTSEAVDAAERLVSGRVLPLRYHKKHVGNEDSEDEGNRDIDTDNDAGGEDDDKSPEQDENASEGDCQSRDYNHGPIKRKKRPKIELI